MSRDGLLGRGLRPCCLRRPRRASPPRQTRRCRRRVRTTTTDEPDHLPSIRHRTLRFDAARPRSLFIRAALPSTLSLAANRLTRDRREGPRSLATARPAPSRTGGSSRATSRAAVSLPAVAGVPTRVVPEKDAPHRVLQPTLLHEHQRTARLPADARAEPVFRRVTTRVPDSSSAEASRRAGSGACPPRSNEPTRWSFA
jgi:hypothetical protein